METIVVGAVTGVFGVKGDLKVKPLVDDESIFDTLKTTVLVDRSGKKTEYTVKLCRPHKDYWLVKLHTVDTPEDGMLLRGSQLTILLDKMPAVSEDEVYWKDIEGSLVMDSAGVHIGTLVDYLETGSHDVFQIAGADGVEYLISNNREHVLDIDPNSKKIVVNRDGLVES